MKQKLLLTLFLIFTIKTFSQDYKFSLEANFPIPVGDNFLGENYGGIIDIGAKYRFTELKIVNIGASINGGFLKNSKADNNNMFDVNVYPIQPRIFAELNIESLSKLHPQIGLGYSFLIFKAKSNGINPDFLESNIDRTEDGINLNFGLSYDITNKLFLQAQYDFVKIGVDNDVPDIKYNTNINILKLGLGFRI
jgi:opacity protein-like surface antigen